MNIYYIYSGDAYTIHGSWILIHEQELDIEGLYKQFGVEDPQAFVKWLVAECGFIIPKTIDLYVD